MSTSRDRHKVMRGRETFKKGQGCFKFLLFPELFPLTYLSLGIRALSVSVYVRIHYPCVVLPCWREAAAFLSYIYIYIYTSVYIYIYICINIYIRIYIYIYIYIYM